MSVLPSLGQPHSSPHKRRYFQRHLDPPLQPRLLSAQAEVFPRKQRIGESSDPLLRTSGGISNTGEKKAGQNHSSPHKRRYFRLVRRTVLGIVLFSAQAEVFPSATWPTTLPGTLLRTSGGISSFSASASSRSISSPHKRRYFHSDRHHVYAQALFSAQAEVFPPAGQRVYGELALLRTSGGISTNDYGATWGQASSPHKRRYFQVRRTI